MFSIFLPKVPPPEAHHPSGQAMPAGSVLVADDDPATRDELRDLLVQAGFAVHVATGGDDAIGQIRRLGERLDLAIIDVIMPDKDGKVVLQELMRISPATAVLMLSGFSREHVRAYLPSGAWRFVQKPVEPEALLSAVRRALEQKKQ
jgi:DNA-binding NtrC family response regulator